MPKVSTNTATGGGDYGMEVDRAETLDGYAVSFLTFRQDIDHSPLLKGLPDDMCQSRHWGYVLKGRLTFRFADHEETVEAGDAFYLPPGHIPVGNEPGTEYLQFSPEEELRPTSDTIMRNFQAMQPNRARSIAGPDRHLPEGTSGPSCGRAGVVCSLRHDPGGAL